MNRVWIALLALALLCGCSRLSQPERETRSDTPAPAPAESASPSAQPLAVYLGVEHYGSVDAAQKDAFRYRFSTGGETVTYAIAPDAAYTIQNLLEEGGVYALTVEQDTVVAAEAVKPVSALPERSDYDRVVRVRTEAGGAVLEEGAPEAAEPVRECFLSIYKMKERGQDHVGPVPVFVPPEADGIQGPERVCQFFRVG